MRMLLTLGIALLMATTASAQTQTTLKMGGQWFSNRGPLVDIPQNGGAQLVLLTGGPCFLQTGCLAFFKPRDGGVPGPITVNGLEDVAVTTNGPGNPATFKIPAGVFSQNPLNTRVSTQLVTIAPDVVQLQSNFRAFAPGSAGTNGEVLNPQTAWTASQVTPVGAINTVMLQGAVAEDRLLRADAWTTQTGRLSPNFTFCPGAITGRETAGNLEKIGGVLGCTTNNPALNLATGPYGIPTSGAFNGIVQYQEGADRFGGTMMMLLDGGGFVSLIRRTTPPDPQSPPTPFSGTTNVVCHQPIGAPGAGGLRNQATGAGYAILTSAFLQGGPCNRGFITNGVNAITQIGPELPAGNPATTFFANQLPPDTNFIHGFPFTTGTISVKNTAGPVSTLTAMGSRNTSMGEGNITLVSGALSHRALANVDTSYVNVVRVSLTPEPGPSLMLGVSLLAIGGLYVGMRRRQSQS